MLSLTVFVTDVGGWPFFGVGIGLGGQQKSVAGAKVPQSSSDHDLNELPHQALV